MDNTPALADCRILVTAEADRWRWSVARDRETAAAGHAPTAVTAGGSARVAAAVITGLGRIARRRF